MTSACRDCLHGSCREITREKCCDDERGGIHSHSCAQPSRGSCTSPRCGALTRCMLWGEARSRRRHARDRPPAAPQCDRATREGGFLMVTALFEVIWAAGAIVLVVVLLATALWVFRGEEEPGGPQRASDPCRRRIRSVASSWEAAGERRVVQLAPPGSPCSVLRPARPAAGHVVRIGASQGCAEAAERQRRQGEVVVACAPTVTG